MNTLLQSAVDDIHPLSEEAHHAFWKRCQPMAFAKKDILLREGVICPGVYFLVQGAVGLYELSDGKEIYQEFFLEGDFATNLPSMSKQEPSKHVLIAPEPDQ